MDIFRPFAKGVDYVLNSNFSIKPQWGKAQAWNTYPLATGRNVVALVGIIGALEGHMAVCLDEKTAIRIAADHTDGFSISRVNKEVESLLREFINMASGNAIARLAEGGLVCDITTPHVVLGKNLEIHCTPPVKTVGIPFCLDQSSLVLFLTLTQSSGNGTSQMKYRIF